MTRPTLGFIKSARLALLLPLLAVGLVSFVYVRIKQGDGSAFVINQRSAEALTPAGVARVVKAAPVDVGGARGIGADCTPLGSGELHNPWRCSISYGAGRRIDYLVQIRLSGSYSGSHQVIHEHGRAYRGNGQISGCCIVIP
jgi:hypothetical protein